MMLLGVALFAAMISAHLIVTELWILVVVRLILGLAESLYFVAGFAALADLAPPGRTGEALSFASVALYLGIALGPGLGQLLLNWHGFAAAWVGGTLLSLLAVAMIWTVPETGGPAPENAQPARLIHRAAIRPGLALFTGVAGTAGFLALVGLPPRLAFPRGASSP
jgi:predicted MFS family arabinose efflux permease